MNDRYKEIRIGPKKFEIPNEWEHKFFDDVIEINPSYDISSLEKLPFLPMDALPENNMKVDYWEERKKENCTTTKFKKNDTLYSKITPCTENGKTVFINDLPQEVGSGSTELIVFSPKNRIIPRYVYYLSKMNLFREITISLMQGSTNRQRVPLDIFKGNIKIPLPPLPEQRRIAEILSTVDDAIQKTDEVIEKAEKLKKGLMQDLLTKGIGHDEFKEVQIGPETVKIPDIWDVKKLKNISDVRASNVNKKSKEEEKPVKLCNYLDVYNNEYIENDMDFMEATAKNREIERFTIEKDDVIITKDSETPDDIAVPAVVIDDLENVLCGYHLTLLKPDKNKINGIFLSKVLQSSPIKNEFCRLAQGLTRYGLNVPSIENALIFVPPLDEQIRIVKILEKIDQKIRTEERVKRNLKELKKGLMQDLLTGKVRVNI